MSELRADSESEINPFALQEEVLSNQKTDGRPVRERVSHHRKVQKRPGGPVGRMSQRGSGVNKDLGRGRRLDNRFFSGSNTGPLSF